MLDKQTATKIDDAISEIHTLLAQDMLRGHSAERIEQAEQKLHDLRNEWAALTGLGLRYASY